MNISKEKIQHAINVAVMHSSHCFHTRSDDGEKRVCGFSEVAMIQRHSSQKTTFTNGCCTTKSLAFDFRCNTENDVNICHDNAMLIHGTQTVLNIAQCDGFFFFQTMFRMNRLCIFEYLTPSKYFIHIIYGVCLYK